MHELLSQSQEQTKLTFFGNSPQLKKATFHYTFNLVIKR